MITFSGVGLQEPVGKKVPVRPVKRSMTLLLFPDKFGSERRSVNAQSAPRAFAVLCCARVAFFVAMLALTAVFLAACSSGDSETSATEPAPAVDLLGGRYLRFNQQWVEGLSADDVDLSDADGLFEIVFAGLPDEITVYPSENYYYFILTLDGKQVWGNIRLPSRSRDNGVLSFGYYEFIEFPSTLIEKASGSKFFTDADGVVVTAVDRFTYNVFFKGKTVVFNLHQLDQTLPPALTLASDEKFLERTYDESGYQFYLVFNETGNYFNWVLNEEDGLPDVFDDFGGGILFGRRSGFVFWVDTEHDNRKVLAGVRRLNVQRNDYYDGPFDQLADNYVDEVQISTYIKRAFPSLDGRIDKYGYYIDRETPLRVAISAYLVYTAQSEMMTLAAQIAIDDEPMALISRGGREATD